MTNPTGRPSTYTRAAADRILSRMTRGYSASIACKMEAMMKFPPVGVSTYWGWVATNVDGLYERDAHARGVLVKIYEDEVKSVANGDHRKIIDETTDELVDGPTMNDPGSLGRDRLVVDELKWHLAKIKPDAWGERPQTIILHSEDLLPVTEAGIDLAQEAALAKAILIRDSKAKPKE